MEQIINRFAAQTKINDAFRTTHALRLTREQHLDNLDVAVFNHIPVATGTLQAFCDGYCAAKEDELRQRHMDYVFRAGGVLYNGLGSDLVHRPHSSLIPDELMSQTEVAFLWHSSEDNFTDWRRLSALLDHAGSPS